MRIAKEKKRKLALEQGGGGEGGGEEEGGGKTVVVGVRVDAESRELLTWALVKVAAPADRVVALHVLPSSSSSAAAASTLDGSPSSPLSLVKTFDSVLAVYEGFCNLKQIDLKLKVCRGSSVRKVLVGEASAFSATTLILGVNKSSRTFGYSSTSVAKYCAKKLAGRCSVIAVNNGKVVFQREASPQPLLVNEKVCEHDFGPPTWLIPLPSHTLRNNSSVIDSSVKKNHSKKPFHHTNSLIKGSLNCSGIGFDSSSPAAEVSRRANHSACNEAKEEKSLALVPVQKISSHLRGSRSGWHLLRRHFLKNKKALYSEPSKVSAFQWVMRLPRRNLSDIHPDHKRTKARANSTLNSDAEGKAIVPVETVLSTQSVTIDDEGRKLPKELESLQEKYSSVCRLFTYKELVQATSNFSSENLIGRGGSSRVYKGCLSDGRELAVKILKSSEDAVKEFASEIEIITILHHKNIISLFGFCFENNNLLLVYDFLSRGSLEENLHGEEAKKNAFIWAERYKVAVGVAEALDYLHSGSVIHRDVKSSNILLSDDFEPQLSDFGLAQWASATASNITCNDVAGTFGYLAPEYFMYGKVTEKIDVYAFGVVLLELISGRKPISTGSSKGQESLVMWANPILQGRKYKQLVDPFLGDEYNHEQMERLFLAASLCLRRAPRFRPKISAILKLIQGDENILKWARIKDGASEVFDELDDESANPDSNIQSHINLALLDIEDDSLSVSSNEPTVDFITANTSLEEYLKGRWSRTSSFD